MCDVFFYFFSSRPTLKPNSSGFCGTCVVGRFDHYIFSKWDEGVCREKGAGIKEAALILPGLYFSFFFFRDVGNVFIQFRPVHSVYYALKPSK